MVCSRKKSNSQWYNFYSYNGFFIAKKFCGINPHLTATKVKIVGVDVRIDDNSAANEKTDQNKSSLKRKICE